jgi:nucleoside-diphosphate-sugar epimerase
MKILVTGASGFLGRALIKTFSNLDDIAVVAVCRGPTSFGQADVQVVEIGDLLEFDNWSSILLDIDVIIHAAGRAHVMNESSMDPLYEFRRVNRDGTLRLAEEAAKAGVKRLIFLSSIKVNGEATLPGRPFTNLSPADPKDYYGKSKLEAEIGLLDLSKQSSLEVTILRPTLIYGDGVKGNFANLIKVLNFNIPLPLGSVNKNRRSLVGVQNLVSLIATCITHKNAANKIFLVSDNECLSTTGLLILLRRSLNSRSVLLPVPTCCLRFLGRLLKKDSYIERLLGSLEVDMTATCTDLDWFPPESIETGLKVFNRTKS